MDTHECYAGLPLEERVRTNGIRCARFPRDLQHIWCLTFDEGTYDLPTALILVRFANCLMGIVWRVPR